MHYSARCILPFMLAVVIISGAVIWTDAVRTFLRLLISTVLWMNVWSFFLPLFLKYICTIIYCWCNSYTFWSLVLKEKVQLNVLPLICLGMGSSRFPYSVSEGYSNLTSNSRRNSQFLIDSLLLFIVEVDNKCMDYVWKLWAAFITSLHSLTGPVGQPLLRQRDRTTVAEQPWQDSRPDKTSGREQTDRSFWTDQPDR